MTRILQSAIFSALTVTLTGNLQAQGFPSKPVRIFTSTAGAGLDFQARLFAPALSKQLQQPIIIENRGGAGGAIVMEMVAKVAPDGHSLLYYGNPVWVLPLMRPVRFDPVRDFSPISLVARSPNVVVVHPSLPVHSIKDLISIAKSSPGKLGYSSGGSGSATHLSAALFTSLAGVQILHVPYKGSAGAMTDLLGNKVQLMFATASTATPHIKSGKLRALAVTSLKSSPLFPGLEPVSAYVTDYESVTLYGMFAPGKTPSGIAQKLNKALVAALRSDEIRKTLAASGTEVVGSSATEFAAVIRDDMSRWSRVIKETGLKER